MIEKIKSFFRNRYGVDELGRLTCILMLIFYVLTLVTKNQILNGISCFFMVVFLMRSLSSNHYAREKENAVLLRKINLHKMRFQNHKTYKYYECKCCSKILRVPKGKGKIEVKCPRCGTKKIHRT